MCAAMEETKLKKRVGRAYYESQTSKQDASDRTPPSGQWEDLVTSFAISAGAKSSLWSCGKLWVALV